MIAILLLIHTQIQTNYSHLKEIRICLSKDDFKPIRCKGKNSHTYKYSRCGKGSWNPKNIFVKYLPKDNYNNFMFNYIGLSDN